MSNVVLALEFLSYALCAPVGGLVPKITSACGVSGNVTGTGLHPTGTAIATGSKPSGPKPTGPAIVPFKGLGAVVRAEAAKIWAGAALVVGLEVAVAW